MNYASVAGRVIICKWQPFVFSPIKVAFATLKRGCAPTMSVLAALGKCKALTFSSNLTLSGDLSEVSVWQVAPGGCFEQVIDQGKL